MKELIDIGGAAGGGSLLGIFLGWIGLGHKIKVLEGNDARIEEKLKTVIFEDRFLEFQKGHDEKLGSIDRTLTTIQGDIKTLIGKE